jgi:hypothetical protein
MYILNVPKTFSMFNVLKLTCSLEWEFRLSGEENNDNISTGLYVHVEVSNVTFSSCQLQRVLGNDGRGASRRLSGCGNNDDDNNNNNKVTIIKI